MNITNFTSSVLSLARGTTFQVIITGAPVQSLSQNMMQFTCKAASLPASSIGKIEIPFWGRKIKYAGDRTYDDWETTLIGENNWTIYKQIYLWHSYMNDPAANVATTTNMQNFKADGRVYVYDQAGNTTLSATLVGLFPLDLGDVALDWDATDQAVDLSVTWSMDYWKLN